MMQCPNLAIVGAGPAGLAAAYESVRQEISVVALEKADQIGGLARTEVYKGYRFDIGGHRFFTKVEEIQSLWEEMLGEDFATVSRLSRVYYRGQFFKYPLELVDTLSKLGLVESTRLILSYLKAKARPSHREDTFDQWVTNRFGRRLYETFFRTYTEKVLGIPCSELQSDWAAQRIAGLSLKTVMLNTLFGAAGTRSLISQFHYPVLGPGMMWQRFGDEVESRGGKVSTGHKVISIEHDGSSVTSLVTIRDGEKAWLRAEHYISSMPLAELVTCLDPPPPEEVVRAARGLQYRDFLVVALLTERSNMFPDQWVYVHSPDVQVGRIQNFGNWSSAMVPDPQTTSLGMEYFCNEGDELWQLPDSELIALAVRELAELGLAGPADVKEGLAVRQAKAYPVYDHAYRGNVAVIRHFLASLVNLQTIGRNGMHRYNNMDHSMLTGILAVRNLLGENHDLWAVNADQAYHERTDKP